MDSFDVGHITPHLVRAMTGAGTLEWFTTVARTQHPDLRLVMTANSEESCRLCPIEMGGEHHRCFRACDTAVASRCDVMTS